MKKMFEEEKQRRKVEKEKVSWYEELFFGSISLFNLHLICTPHNISCHILLNIGYTVYIFLIPSSIYTLSHNDEAKTVKKNWLIDQIK